MHLRHHKMQLRHIVKAQKTLPLTLGQQGETASSNVTDHFIQSRHKTPRVKGLDFFNPPIVIFHGNLR